MRFPTTRWDEIAKASLHGDAVARATLDEFCRRYWQPVNHFIRRKGYNDMEAADLTQDFFLDFLETQSWKRADQLRGSFRTFLLGALTHRLQKAQAHQMRLKRGGANLTLSLDEIMEGENVNGNVPSVTPSEVLQFDYGWAVHIVNSAMLKLRENYVTHEKLGLYEELKAFLIPSHSPPGYEEVARRLSLNSGTVKSEIHRLRQAFRLALRREIGQTVSAPHEIEEELQHLRAVLSNRGSLE